MVISGQQINIGLNVFSTSLQYLFNVHFFDLVSKDDFIVLTSRDFEAAGYTVEKLSPCLIRLYTSNFEHFALCSPEPLERNTNQGLVSTKPLS